MDPSIFKAYDIRGIYPAQIDAEVARRVGRAFIDYLRARRIAVGHDMRASSPELAGGFIRGVRSQGTEVVDIGTVGTDMLYFAVASANLEGGAIITASHNPKEWNGIKMVRRGAEALSGDAGIKEVKEAVLAGRFADDPGDTGPPVVRKDIREDYARHCLAFIDPARVPPMTVVLDAGNGMGSVGAEAIFPRLPLQLVKMFFELDGTFPNHPPDPLIEANRQAIMARVKAEKADLGIAWDGDADRCFFIDDTGAFVPGDFVTALLAESFCRKEKGAKIVYDVRASRAVADRVQAAGGTALMNRVGHAFIKKRMREENAVFGGEVSGHFYFRENSYADNGMIPALLVLELLGAGSQRLSELLAPLRQRYHISGEINSTVKDPEAVIQRIDQRYRDARILRMDGINVDYPDWHFNVRASNTEPLVRLNLEAYDQPGMERHRDEVLGLIRQ
ncbi:MAG: phosphomannomutase/phosphoglucomutase [Acidobacteria bacterium]|nr:MAG: phosphomannomutase/phosphoglucomutase [Acidobacteriota bacterium]PYQ22316.1 MAG: phosphomannomutase/phosphoglucomutase [Acidobacteriota bacterium]